MMHVKICKNKNKRPLFRGWRRVEIRTDSNYAIQAVTEFAYIWRENADENGNWYNSKGKNV